MQRSRTGCVRRKCVGALGLFFVLAGTVALLLATLGEPALAEPATPLDPAIALLDEARLQFRSVRDYECKLIKRERVHGKLLPESRMSLKVRNEPFSIYLRCETPGSAKGVEVCYVAGRNRGKMRVHPNGLLSFIGFVSIDPHDPRALEENRHCITEAGLGHLLESTARYWEMERRLNKTRVAICDQEFDGHTCTRIETTHPDQAAGSFYAYRCVLWLDKETRLPVGAETYDWPRPNGPVHGELLEQYRYGEIRRNLGLDDAVFAR